MREIRTSGSEGGGAEINRLFLPLSGDVCIYTTFPINRSSAGNAGAPARHGSEADVEENRRIPILILPASPAMRADLAARSL